MTSNIRREKVYLRDRKEPTPAQRRRLKQKEGHSKAVRRRKDRLRRAQKKVGK